MEQQREDRFVIVRFDVLQSKDLTPSEKLIYARICSFKEYFESKEECAETLGVSKDTVVKAKQKLLRSGYIKEVENTGRGKVYQAVYDEQGRVVKSTNQSGKKAPIRVVKSTNIEEIEKKEKTTTKVVVAGDPATPTRSLEDLELDQKKNGGVVEKATPHYGNAEINAAMAYFEERLKLDPKSRWARARAKNLISKHGLEVVKQGIDIAAIAQDDPYGPKVSNMEKLFYKWNDLILYARKKDGEFNSGSGITVI